MEEKIKQEYRWNPETRCREWVDVPTGKFKFTEEDKIMIVSEYTRGGVTAQQIIEKYHISHRQTLFNWMDKYCNETESVSLPDNQSDDPMAKKTPEERIKDLETENKRLKKALELEELRSKAFDTMINVAEQTFNIPIRKKSGTKQ